MRSSASDRLYTCSFARGKWRTGEWIKVKSPRWEHFGNWIQRDDYIENETPADATPAELRGKRAGETYTSMVLRRRFSGNLMVSARMAFSDRMAPLIVVAPELGRDALGRPEYREHFEIVLFDRGINVWHHLYENGKPHWRKRAYWQGRLEPGRPYRLGVKVRRTRSGVMVSLFVDGKEKMGYMEDAWPARFHLGITGCEGVNRFYDFRVEK